MAEDTAMAQVKSTGDAAKIDPKLAALSLAKELMSGDSPTTAIISDEFCMGKALLQNINIAFFDKGLDGITDVFDQFERHSPSIGGVGRQQVVECVVNASRPVYQNAYPLGEPPGPGIFERLANFIRGNKQPGQ